MTDTTILPPARCTATNRRGEPCKRFPMTGATVCAMHGGKAPQTLRKARQRIAEQEAARRVAEWGGRLDLTPPEALLELVQTKASEVAFWNHKVTQDDDAPTALAYLHKVQDQLANYSAAAVRVGVDEALVRVATLQAAAVVDLARRAIASARQHPTLDADGIILQLIDTADGLPPMDGITAPAVSAHRMNADVSWVHDVMMNAFQRLNLTDDQWTAVPGVMVDELEALERGGNS